MNKKVMAVAVVAALAAPATALAQITVLGRFVAEFSPAAGQMDQPDPGGPNGPSRDTADGFNSPASWIRFAAEEKLGGGYSIWAQCESRARWGVDTNPNQGGGTFCDRNSALGIKGSFGNFFVGRWDTAVEDSSGLTRIVGSTGWDGRQHMLTEDQGQAGISFAQRVQNSLNYNSPNFNGFQVNLSTTTTGAQLNTSAGAGNQGLDGRIYSILAKYASGPLVGYVGYEKHDDNQALMSGGQDGATEHMVTFGVSYVFGPVKLGVVYTDVDGDVDVPTGLDVSRTSWQIAGDWKVTPAGSVRFAYTQADDYEGSAAAGTSDTGAKQYSLGYYHSLSKRTIVGAYYTKVDNDSNGVYNYHSFNSAVKPGDSAGAFVLHAAHNF